MKYVVDEIIDNIIILENIKTGKIKKVKKIDLPKNCREKNVVIEENGQYRIDYQEEQERIRFLKEKMNQLKK